MANFIEKNVDEKHGNELKEVWVKEKRLNPENSGNANTDQKSIAMDVNQLNQWEKYLAWGFNESTAFLINHGAGHNSDVRLLKKNGVLEVMGHGEDGGAAIMDVEPSPTDPNAAINLQSRLRDKKSVLDKIRNSKFIDFIRARFSSKEPSDNRNKPKWTRETEG